MFEQSNPLIAAANTGKRLTPGWLAPPLAWGFFIGSLILRGVLEGLLVPSADGFATALSQTVFLVLTFALVVVLLWLWLRFYEQRKLSTLGLQNERVIPKIVLGFAIGAGLLALAFGAAVVLGAYTGTAADWSALPAVLLILVGWMVQGSTEEIVFRGWLLPVMGARYKVWVGIVVSSALFALLHSFNPGITLLAVVNVALFGLFAALYALREGSIWGICALHVVWNWLISSVLGTAVSGASVAVTLFEFTPTDAPELLTGGGFGVEGSILTTIVLAVANGVVWWSGRNGRKMPS
jgi:hypothetical protein